MTEDVPAVEGVVPRDLIPRTAVPDRWPAITERLARRLTTEGRIPSWRIGLRVFVSVGDVEAWIAACRRPIT